MRYVVLRDVQPVAAVETQTGPERAKLTKRYWELNHACAWGRHGPQEWRTLYEEKLRVVEALGEYPAGPS